MISEERIKKFWEWCGFEYKPLRCQCRGCSASAWIMPTDKKLKDGRKPEYRCGLPDLDLNSLFKWAIPKVRGVGCHAMLSDKSDDEGVIWMARVYGKNTHGFLDALDEDPAIALFTAIEKLMEV